MTRSRIVSFESSTQVAVEEAEYRTVPSRDWRRIRKRVAAIEHPVPWAREAFVLCVGMVPPAGLGLATWAATYTSLPAATQAQFWWIGPVTGALFLGAIGVGVVSFLMHRQGVQHVKREAELICEDMDSVVPPGEKVTPQVASDEGTA